MDGRHGRLDEGEDDSTVGIVNDEETSQNLVLPRKICDAMLKWQGLHVVKEGHETRNLHGEPGNSAWDVEFAFNRSLSHAIP